MRATEPCFGAPGAKTCWHSYLAPSLDDRISASPQPSSYSDKLASRRTLRIYPGSWVPCELGSTVSSRNAQ